jgi:hypothetical protein
LNDKGIAIFIRGILTRIRTARHRVMWPRAVPPAGIFGPNRKQASHVAVWRETYGAVAPPAVVAALDEAHRLKHWAAALAAPETLWGCVLALEGRAIVGQVSFDPAK